MTIVTLLYFLLTIVMTWPMLPQFAKAIPGDGFDGWQNYWNLWWVKVALVDRIQSPFQTDALYAPTGVALYFHTLNPFNGVTTLPIQLSSGLRQAYNSVVLLSWTLGGLGAFLLTRWLLRAPSYSTTLASSLHSQDMRNQGTLRHGSVGQNLVQNLPPFVAGLIFTFSPIHMAHLLGHMQVMSLQWIPFYILALMQSLDRRRRGQPWHRSALLAGLFLVLCGLCDWYFVLYLFFFTGLLISWHLLSDSIRSRQPLKALATWTIPPMWAALVFVFLLSPLLVPMIQTASQLSFMVRPESDFYILSASLADFLIPTRLHTLFRNDSFGWVGNQIAPVSERTIGIGYVAILLGVLALVWDRKRSAFWAGVAAFFLLMALGPVMHWGNIAWSDIPMDPALELPEELAAQLAPADTVHGGLSLFAILNNNVPFMEISRSVSRYALMVQLAVAVLAGMGLAGLLRRWARKGGPIHQRLWLTALILPLIILFEYWVAPFPMSPPDTPAVYADANYFGGAMDTGQGRAHSSVGLSVLNVPMNFDRPGYLLYQTVHQHPLTVAYISRDDPRTFTERMPVLQHFRHLGPDILADDPARVGHTVLADLRVGTVVLDRYKMPGGHEREYTTALAQAIFDQSPPAYEDDRITLYQVQAPESPQPYLSLGPLNWGPLRKDEDRHFRSLLAGPAQIQIRHLPMEEIDSWVVDIHYRTQNGATAEVHGGLDVPAQLLPAADETATVTIPLQKLRPLPSEESGEALFVWELFASEPEWVEIEKLELRR